MIEIWELVDKNKNKTNTLHQRGDEKNIPKGMYHLVVETWVKNSKGQILLTQRHANKNYGLMWECSGGSVIAGEDSVEAAARELFEETGICANAKNLKHLGETIKENYIVDTYLYVLNEEMPQLFLQAEEVVDAMWVTMREMNAKREMIVRGVWERYCRFEEQIRNAQK